MSRQEWGRTCAQDREHNRIPSIETKIMGTRLNWPRVVVQVMSKRCEKE